MNTPYMPPAQGKMMKGIAVVMAPLTLYFTLAFPAGLQLFFLVTGGLQSFQSWVFFQPWFRRAVGLPLLDRNPTKPATSRFAPTYEAARTVNTTATPVNDGIVSGKLADVKDGLKAVQNRVDQYQQKQESKKAVSNIKEYEEKRRAEEQARYYARIEEQRSRAAARQRQR
jgi:membrane protein insertase Oxa1/YidC/SpoIIIJ